MNPLKLKSTLAEALYKALEHIDGEKGPAFVSYAFAQQLKLELLQYVR